MVRASNAPLGFGPRRLVSTFARALAPALLALCIAESAPAVTHEVKPGESLWVLAKRYGVGVEAIQKANRLGGDAIRAGQKLTIPVKPATDTKPAVTEAKPKAKPAPEAKPVAQATTKAEPAPAKPVTEARPAPVRPKSLPKPTRAQVAAAEKLYAEPAPSSPPSTLEERAPAWVMELPPKSARVEKSNAARGGVFPCAAPDPGFGNYGKWQQVAPMAHVLVPKDLDLGASGEFDALFHFHGREPARKEWVRVMDRAVLIAVDVGIDSGSYAVAFQDPRTFGEVMRAVEAEVARQTNRSDVAVRHVGVSSWSAGYGAVEQILSQPYAQQNLDTVILLDGLHSGYTAHSLDGTKLAPFVRFAERAKAGETFMFVSHSSILTQGYASTTETAQYLLWKLGGRSQSAPALSTDPMGLERISASSLGDFHVRGFRGIGAADHCAHLGLLRDILRVHVKPRWENTPSHDTSGVVAHRDSHED